MKYIHHVLLILFVLVCFKPVYAEETGITLNWQQKNFVAQNTLNINRSNALTCIPVSTIEHVNIPTTDFVVLVNKAKVASQIAHCPIDNNKLSIIFSADYTAHENKFVSVYWQNNVKHEVVDPVNAVAELQVRVAGRKVGDKFEGGYYIPVTNYTLPKEHTIGNKLFKYEGIGWESNQIAYRYYFDHRGAIDIFGKTKEGLFLANIGLDGGDYHQLSEWGMDILKVGSSLGIGGIATWKNNKLIGATNFDELSAQVKSGVVIAEVTLNYKQWQVDDKKDDLTLVMQISADSSLTHMRANTKMPLDNWATGIVKHQVEKLSKIDKHSKWNYLATWGKQSLNNDNLGMAIFFKNNELLELNQDTNNELVILNGTKGVVEYYFDSQWSASTNGITTKQQYIEYLNNTIEQLNAPIIVKPSE